MKKKMKFTIEFEVPENITEFYGMSLKLNTISEDGSMIWWPSVLDYAHKKQRVRDGKHLHYDNRICTVECVGERLEGEK